MDIYFRQEFIKRAGCGLAFLFRNAIKKAHRNDALRKRGNGLLYQDV